MPRILYWFYSLRLLFTHMPVAFQLLADNTSPITTIITVRKSFLYRQDLNADAAQGRPSHLQWHHRPRPPTARCRLCCFLLQEQTQISVWSLSLLQGDSLSEQLYFLSSICSTCRRLDQTCSVVCLHWIQIRSALKTSDAKKNTSHRHRKQMNRDWVKNYSVIMFVKLH